MNEDLDIDWFKLFLDIVIIIYIGHFIYSIIIYSIIRHLYNNNKRMEREYGKDLDIDRQVRKPFGFKADRIHRSVLVDSSNAKPGGSLNVQLHKIKNEPIIPGSLHITFKAKIISEKDRTSSFVQNLGRALIVEKELTFNGKRATVINEYDEFKIYSDLWLSKGERKDRVKQGIQSENGLKYRIGSKTKNSSNQLVDVDVNDEEKALKIAYGSTFKIPLDDELFTEVAPFCPYFINDNVVLEFKLSEAKNIILSSDVDAIYEISAWNGMVYQIYHITGIPCNTKGFEYDVRQSKIFMKRISF